MKTPCPFSSRPRRRAPGVIGWVLVAALCGSCQSRPVFDPGNLAEGPGGMVGNGDPLTDGNFAGGNDVLPSPRPVMPPDGTRPPDCDGACIAFCEGLALDNPVNRGLCRSLWGVGLAPRPIDPTLACRRMFVDMQGRLPTWEESAAVCQSDWGATARRLMADEAFVLVNQRHAADTFLYSSQAVSVSRIYDMDRLVRKLHEGRVPYDLFAAVASAHPVITRRFADPGDSAEAIFRLFLGRPPFDNERADMGRLYALWEDGYVDHPQLNMRLPDAFIRFRCLDENGQVDENRKGECTSVLWGYHELIFTPDIRAARDPEDQELTLWSGLLSPEEWTRLQVPGRALSQQLAFWEKAVSNVVVQYLGYDLTEQVPEVREELVRYLLRYQGDIRSVHFAVATSIAYLQTYEGTSSAPYRWTFGPMKQMEAEVWLDSLARATGKPIASCDHRISNPDAFVESGSLAAYRVVEKSRWSFTDEGEVDHSYSSMARTLGGCPENVVGGRFKVLSILTTATQLNYVNQLCNPTGDGAIEGVPIASLLPQGMSPARAVDAASATQIAEHQYRLFYGRDPSAEERDEAAQAGTECAASLCSAEQFARPLCFALLSSADLLFY